MNSDTHHGGQRRSLWKGPAAVAAGFLSLLGVASWRIDDWHWPPQAFAVVGGLVFGLGVAYQWVTRNRETFEYRAAVGIAFVAGFMLLWGNFVQMADVNPLAAMYFAVPVVGLVGTAVARLRPRGMAQALGITALAQISVLAVLAVLLMTRKPEVTTWTPPEWRGFFGNAMNGLMFAASALLFRKAGHRETPQGSVL